MAKIETWDIFMPEDSQDFTSKSYYQWRVEVLRNTDMAEYRLRKLYRLGFTPQDIARDRHHEVFPPPKLRVKRVAPHSKATRGRTLGAKRKAWIYAKVLHEAAESILLFYRLEPAMLAEVRADAARFKELRRKYHPGGKQLTRTKIVEV